MVIRLFLLFTFFVYFSYAEDNLNLINVFENQLKELKGYLNSFKHPEVLNIPYKDSGSTGFLDTDKKILLLKKKSGIKLFNLELGMDYNSQQVVADDRYPFTFRTYIGLSFPVLKGGLLEYKYKDRYYKQFEKLYSVKYTLPVKEISILSAGISKIEIHNQTLINMSQKEFLVKLSRILKPIADYDKYYKFTLSLIESINKEIKRDFMLESDKLQVYRFCVVEPSSVRESLKRYYRTLVRTIRSTKVPQVNSMLLNSELDVGIRYNYRKGAESNLTNDYFSIFVKFEMPIYYSKNLQYEIEKLTLLREKQKLLYDFFNLKSSIESEILIQNQNFYSYKNHIIEAQTTISQIEREINMVKLGIKQMDVGKFIGMFRKLYNHLSLINIYHQKVFLSYQRIKSLVKKIDKDAKVVCKVGL